MIAPTETESRKMLGALRDAMASGDKGQARLNRIVQLIAASMATEVCSIYLFRDRETLELCATEGLNPDAVHTTRMRLSEGLVGRVARRRQIVNTADAPTAKGFRFMPETGEEVFSSFLGVPIQRLGEVLGVLVVQSKATRAYSEDEVYALEVVAMVLAEMTELGEITDDDGYLAARHRQPMMILGVTGQEGVAEGTVFLHEPRVVVTNPFAEDTDHELKRLAEGLDQLRLSVDDMLSGVASASKEHREVVETYRMFAASRSWRRRMEEDIQRGLSAEAAVEKEQSAARARMSGADAYLRDRLSDLDDLSNRLLRILTGQGAANGELPADAVLVARNIGPGELLDYGRKLKGIVLEEGSVGSHAAIVARSWSIPLIINARGIVEEALNGDAILVDGDTSRAHLRPEENVLAAFRDKIAMQAEAQTRYATIRELPALCQCGSRIELHMNAGLMAD
ncbi:MAG: PEP-utilizing enzyme, partial [Shimia sp.]